MFKCRNCGKVFEEPSIRQFWEDMNGEGALERQYVFYCPFCGDEEFDEEED